MYTSNLTGQREEGGRCQESTVSSLNPDAWGFPFLSSRDWGPWGKAGGVQAMRGHGGALWGPGPGSLGGPQRW